MAKKKEEKVLKLNRYQWKSGRRFSVKAQEAGERLEWLGKKNSGRVTPQMVVDDARRHRNSPFRSAFDWNIRSAAKKHWLQQARALINSLTIVVRFEGDLEPRKIQAHVSIATDPLNRAYIPTRQVVNDPALENLMLRDALRLLESWRARFGHLQALKPMLDAIDGVNVALKIG